MSGARPAGWDATVALHHAAAADFAAAAEALEDGVWEAPRAPGKWSPAEIVEHLSLAYDVLLGELAGGAGMALRTRWWQRALLRWTLVPRLLGGARFPRGAIAPRETRPSGGTADRAAAVARFRERAATFERAIAEARRERPDGRLTHAYFGSSSYEDALLLSARHVQHHRAQLPGAAPRQPA